MPLIFIFVVGIAVVLFRRRLLAAVGDPALRQDAPARLLGWAVGLLAAEREEWGQAMIGELDRLDGRARRWRFALGCVGAAVVMPPWGRAAAALLAMIAVGASAGGLVVYTHIHYRLTTDGWTWLWGVILTLAVTGYILGGSALLRRPRVAGPGLAGGLLVTAAWLAAGGFTFNSWLNSRGLGSAQWLLLLAPVVVGVGGTLWGGDAVVGRRAARLATVTAALGVYLYGVLAVAIHGAIGHDPSDGWTTAQIVADNLGNQAIFYLMALPLATATIGWAAAAATARLRHGRGPSAPPVAASTGPGAEAALTGTALTMTASQRRIWYLILAGAALPASAFLVFLTLLRG